MKRNNFYNDRNDSLSKIYLKHYNANRTDKDYEDQLAGENVSAGILGGGIGALTGLTIGGMKQKMGAGTLAGLLAGSISGYGAGRLTESIRRKYKHKSREEAKAALNKKASLYEAATIGYLNDIEQNTRRANAIAEAKEVAKRNGITNFDPRDSDDYLSLENYFDSYDSDLVDQYVNGPKRTKRAFSTLAGAAIGGLAPITLDELKGNGGLMTTPFKLKYLAGSIAGGIAGNQLGKLFSKAHYHYNEDEARDRVVRDRKAYKDALQEKYGK